MATVPTHSQRGQKTMFDEYKLTIGSHFAIAISYGDPLQDDDEEGALANFLSRLPARGVWEFNEVVEFTQCEITGLYGECYRAIYYAPINTKKGK